VLTGSGFRNDAFLTHPHCQETLAETIVDFVRTGVIEILALQVYLRPSPGLRQARGKVEGSGPAGVVLE
jgi:hypothetical protein